MTTRNEIECQAVVAVLLETAIAYCIDLCNADVIDIAERFDKEREQKIAFAFLREFCAQMGEVDPKERGSDKKST